MESDDGKLFVGGIAWDTTEDRLKDYFGQYGEVTQTVIMRDKTTNRPRGFGFVVFSDPSILDTVLNDKHTIDGRVVEAKRALSREEQQTSSKGGNFNANRNSGGGGNFRTKKIFVGGLPSSLTEDGFRQFFESFGHVSDVVIMFDQNTQRPRGFGFITFDSEDAVDRVLNRNFHELNGKLVEVKRALPKDLNSGGGGRGGGYQGYSGSSTNAFDGRMDGNRYMQSQTTAGGFPPYSGYGAPGYGYGATNSVMGYAGYGSYGVGAYGGPGPGASAGFGAPGGSYGNTNAPGYGGGAAGAMKNTWNSQSPSGYGASGYGAAATWGASGGGAAASAPRGQSPSGTSGYGNQGYGYGNYGGNFGPYGGYGASGGRAGSVPSSNAGGVDQQGIGGGYMGSGYGDTNGNSGYSNAGWRSDPSQAAGGYGSAQSRQV